MTRRLLLQALSLSVLLSACAAPQLRNQFSPVQLSEAVQQADHLAIKLRVSNFGEDPIEIKGLQFTLSISDGTPASQQRTITYTLPGYGVETFQFSLPGVQIVAAGRSVPDSVHYLLEGKLSRGGFGGQIPFRHEGRLSPVPGVPGGWR